LTTQPIESNFLGYNVEYKGYRCWDPIAQQIKTSRDVVFDEFRPSCPRPSSDASFTSLVDPICFLFFSNTLLLLYRFHTHHNLVLWSLLL
jgi:hypothetical protein